MEFNSLLSRTTFKSSLLATARRRPFPSGDPKVLPIMPQERARAPECTARACVRAYARVAPLPCDRGKIPNTSKQKKFREAVPSFQAAEAGRWLLFRRGSVC